MMRVGESPTVDKIMTSTGLLFLLLLATGVYARLGQAVVSAHCDARTGVTRHDGVCETRGAGCQV